MIYLLDMVNFRSYVGLPEGNGIQYIYIYIYIMMGDGFSQWERNFLVNMFVFRGAAEMQIQIVS